MREAFARAAACVRRRGARVFSTVLVLALSHCSTSQAPTQTAPAAPATPEATSPAVAPEAIAGTWLVEMKNAGQSVQYSLHFTVTAGILAGSLTGPDGNARELTNIALKENKIAWDAETPFGKEHSEGTVSGSSMKGTAKLTARRRERGEPDGGSDPGSTGASRSGGHGRRGGRGGRGGSKGGQKTTWSAYKSVAPPSDETPPAAIPTPSSSSA